MSKNRVRAWDKINKKMIDTPMAICSGDGGWVLFTAEIEGLDCSKAIHPIQQYEFMQHTGLYDKNGEPVFEGDIVVTGFGENYVKSIVRIGEAETSVDTYERSYAKSYYGVYLEGSIDLEEYLLEGRMYILGNIYENPELSPFK